MWLGALRRIETKTARNIETDLEFVLRPRQPGLVLDHSEMATWLRPKPAESAPFSAGDDTRSRPARLLARPTPTLSPPYPTVLPEVYNPPPSGPVFHEYPFLEGSYAFSKKLKALAPSHPVSDRSCPRPAVSNPARRLRRRKPAGRRHPETATDRRLQPHFPHGQQYFRSGSRTRCRQVAAHLHP